LNINKKNTNGFCIWLIGLEGSGKSTLARLLEVSFKKYGLRVEVLDEKNIEKFSNTIFDYTFDNQRNHLLSLASEADRLSRKGVSVVVAAVTPYQSIRDEIKKTINNLIEVFVNAPLDVCTKRCPQKRYACTSTKTSFEFPTYSEIEVLTHKERPQESVDRILRGLEILGVVSSGIREDLTEEESAAVEKQLRALGYL
jgi:adenylylsulfate kinase